MTRKEVRNANRSTSKGASVGYEAELWKMADARRGCMDAVENRGALFFGDFILGEQKKVARPRRGLYG